MSDNEQQQQPNGDRMDRFELGLERLLKVQASHDARIERLLGVQSDHAARHQMAELRLDRIERSLDGLVSLQQRHERELDGLMEIIQRHSRETAERFRDTGDKLNTLVRVVDDLVRKRPPEAPAN